MRPKADKIERVVALASAEERRYGEATGASRRRLEEQQQRLGELNAYRANYAATSSQVRDVHAAHWKDYQGFLARLDTAVQSQQQIVLDCEKNLETHRRRWMIKRQRLASLEQVLERCRSEEARFRDRQEQRQVDDRAPVATPYQAPEEDWE